RGRSSMILFVSYVNIKFLIFTVGVATDGPAAPPRQRRRSSMTRATIVAALGTPLHADEGLHHEGFTLQLERVRSAGIDGVFVAGTFGMSPLLTDETYHALIRHAVSVIRGGVELF